MTSTTRQTAITIISWLRPIRNFILSLPGGVFVIKRIIPSFLVFVMLISCAFPVFADDDYTNSWKSSGYWDGVLHRAVKSTNNWDWGGLVQGLAGLLSSDICRVSDDGLHHADKPDRCGNFRRGFDGGPSSAMAYCTCKYCGQSFSLMITSDDLKKQYTAAVTDLPASSLDSEGYLIWKPKFKCLAVGAGNYLTWFGDTTDTSYDFGYSMSVDMGEVSSIILTSNTSSLSSGNKTFKFYYADTAPVTGYYMAATRLQASYSGLDGSGSAIKPGARSYSFDSQKYYAAGNSYSAFASDLVWFDFWPYVKYSFYPMLVKIKPLSGLVDTSKDNSYGTSTRPGALIGDFNIVNNNTTTKVENTTIVNETNNTYYNPVTNETHNYNNWTYDYSSRTL